MIKFQKNKGFTLLEILVSTTIFAIIMIMTTATIAQSSSYKNKLRALRESSEESRRLADQITRDVRSASTKIKFQKLESDPDSPQAWKTYKNGVFLLKCDTACNYVDNEYASLDIDNGDFFSGSPSFSANVLVVATKDDIRIYKVAPDYSGIYYKTIAVPSGGMPVLYTSNILNMNDNDKITSSSTQTVVNFGGFAPSDCTVTEQPYIQFYITSRTKDYDNLSTSERALVSIKSTVSSRSFNNH